MSNSAEIERFYNLLMIKPLPTSAIALWQALNFLHSKCQKEWFTAANKTLQLFTGLSRQSIYDTRNILKQNGLADFRSNGTKASSYKVTMPYFLQDALQNSLQDTLQNNLQDTCTLNKLNYIKLLNLFNYINGKEKFFDGVSDKDKLAITSTIKRIGIYAANTDVLEEERQKHFVIMYWCIKELYFSSFKIYLNDIDEQFFINKFLKTLEMLNVEKIDIEQDLDDIVNYFIKTLKREYEVKK